MFWPVNIEIVISGIKVFEGFREINEKILKDTEKDVVVMLLRDLRDFFQPDELAIARPNNATLLGAASKGTVCREYSKSLAMLSAGDQSILSQLVAAHEIAHVLGLGHDGDIISDMPDLPPCSAEDGFIMVPDAGYYSQNPNILDYGLFWSECSKKHLLHLANSDAWACLGTEAPQDPKYPLVKIKRSWMMYSQRILFLLGICILTPLIILRRNFCQECYEESLSQQKLEMKTEEICKQIEQCEEFLTISPRDMELELRIENLIEEIKKNKDIIEKLMEARKL